MNNNWKDAVIDRLVSLHNHEWFRTGGMKPGQFRCIHCGTWAQEEQQAYNYAKSIAEAIWKKHYKDTAPHWKPDNDLFILLTQIDNMTAALATPRRQTDQEPEAYKITGKLGDICHFKSSSVRKGDVVYTVSARGEKEQEQDPMPRWKIDELMRDAGWQNSALRQADLDKVEKVVRAVEQALKEKNHA